MISFTICSNNYLAEAITLGESLILNGENKENYLIFLADELNNKIQYDILPFEIIPLSNEIVSEFSKLKNYYDIIELSTSVKPSVFKYLIKRFTDVNIFIYLDPDLYFLQPLATIALELGDYSALITPHLLNPVSPDKQPFENIFLNFGIYNLGFIAIKVDENSLALLNWWEERTLKFGVINVAKGFFVDQLWINLAPIFFKNVKISVHPGFNVAYWNLEERKINKKENLLNVQNEYNLVFFHFSSFDYSLKKLSIRAYSEPSYGMSVLKELMLDYQKKLDLNGYKKFKTIAPANQVSFENFVKKQFSTNITPKKAYTVIRILRFIPKKTLRRILNFSHIASTLGKTNFK